MPIDFQLDSKSRREAIEKMFKGSLVAGSLSVLPLAQAEEANFSEGERALLEAVAYTLFPHAALEPSHYKNAALAVQGALAADLAKLTEARKILASLESSGFLTASQPDRERQLKDFEKSDLFSTAYSTTLNTLYSDKGVWAKFGYEGSAVEHGGYLKRGFNNINWLPRRK